MNYMAVTYADFADVVSAITDEFTVTGLVGILAGVIGVTVTFTLVWRFAAYIRNSIVGGMTNSKGKRRG